MLLRFGAAAVIALGAVGLVMLLRDSDLPLGWALVVFWVVATACVAAPLVRKGLRERRPLSPRFVLVELGLLRDRRTRDR